MILYSTFESISIIGTFNHLFAVLLGKRADLPSNVEHSGVRRGQQVQVQVAAGLHLASHFLIASLTGW